MLYVLLVYVASDDSFIDEVDDERVVEDVVPIVFESSKPLDLDRISGKLHDLLVDHVLMNPEELHSRTIEEYRGKIRSLVLSKFNEVVAEQKYVGGVDIDIKDIEYKYIEIYTADLDETYL